MSAEIIGVIGLFFLFALILLGMPVAFVMTLVGIVGFACIVSPTAAFDLAVRDFFSVFNLYTLTVLPLFILMGQVAFHSGISGRLFHSANCFLGHLRGGLAIATIGASAGFSAICGSTSATAATMASVALPEMKKYNYDPALATGVVAAGGSLGILIPPSTIFIVYGIMTEQSIGALFLAGIVPGILLALLLIAVILIWTGLNPSLCAIAAKSSWRERLKSLKGIVETLILFVLVMGGLFGGLFTPTETASVGAFGVIVIAVIQGNLPWQGFKEAIGETVRISCMVMMIVAGATVFGHFLAVTNIPMSIGEWIGSLGIGKAAVIVLLIIFYVILGCMMDSLAMILLTLPMVFPIMQHFGVDPIWFGVIMVIVAEVGVLTPPVGINVFVVAGVAKNVPLQTIFRGTARLIIAPIILIALLLLFPDLALWLPQYLK
ncbi:MAG: TRAP transporter large permease [Deltaproteobacteria bacterium]|nr:TRAP transporter large permease [Deltaproteobacteria bacterium]